MPAAVIAAGVGAAGALGGGILASKGAGKAADASAKANADALAWEKQKFEEEQALQRQQWEAEQAQAAPRRALRDAYLRGIAAKYGVKLPSTSPATGTRPLDTTLPTTTPAASTAAPTTLGQIMRMNATSLRRQPLTPALQAPPVTLGTLMGRG